MSTKYQSLDRIVLFKYLSQDRLENEQDVNILKTGTTFHHSRIFSTENVNLINCLIHYKM